MAYHQIQLMTSIEIAMDLYGLQPKMALTAMTEKTSKHIKLLRLIRPHFAATQTYSILIDQCENFLVGSANGLNKYNFALDRFDRLLEGFEVREIIEYSKVVRYLIASDQGIIQLDTSFNIISNYTHDENDPNSISSNAVTCIFEDSKNRVWAGTTPSRDGFNDTK